jgi:hypothetical protein
VTRIMLTATDQHEPIQLVVPGHQDEPSTHDTALQLLKVARRPEQPPDNTDYQVVPTVL